MTGTQIQRRRGTTEQHSTFTGALGELTVDTDKKTVVVHDGITAGGSPLAVAATVAATYAPLASPALTGTPTAPTAAAGTNTTQIATTAFVKAEADAVAVSFASSAENAAGTVEGKAVDPLGIREALNASGSAPVFACRAWVNFNGTGTVAIRASGNISSITDNGTGDYTVNFTNALPDAKYSVVGTTCQFNGGEPGGVSVAFASRTSEPATLKSTSQVRIYTGVASSGGEKYDYVDVNVAIFR